MLSIVCFIPWKESKMAEKILQVVVVMIAVPLVTGAVWLLLDIADENQSAKLARKIEERKRRGKPDGK